MIRRGFILVCFMAAVCSCASVTGDSVKNANYHYRMGISYLNDNNIQPAYVEFQKALELNPRDKEVHQALGIIYLTKLEDYPRAVKHFQGALDIDRNFSEAATNLGNAYAQMGEFDKAIRSYQMAVSNPQYKNAAMALNNMGMVYYRLSRPDDALSAFKESLRRYSDFHAPYYGLALCYNAKGQYGDAALALTRAIELDPLYRGDKEKAMADFMEKKLRAMGEEEKDISDFLEILRY